MRTRLSVVGVLAFGVGVVCLSGLNVASAQKASELWGERGERWDPSGRLPDYSYAGYHSGEKAIPNVAVVTDITDFGAVANDNRDDSEALQAAIDATRDGAVFIPKGTFRLEKPILVEKSAVVIRGEGSGPNGTVLYVPQNATERAGGNFDRGFAVGLKGFIIKFEGAKPTGETGIVSSTRRGERTIRLQDASQFSAGGEIHIGLTDESLYGSLFTHLHNERLSGWSQGTPSLKCGPNDKWPFTIESINGNEVTLKEPLPFDIRKEWSPVAERGRPIVENGIENLRIRFRYAPQSVHLLEPGNNGIHFVYVRDSWVRNVALEDIDNGITLDKQSSRNTLKDIVVDGRPGHHVTTLSRSPYNLIDGFRVNVDESEDNWIHSFTLDHVAQGNVTQRVSSNKTLRLDLHRDSPFDNLFTEVLSKANFKSGGDRCYGPHTAARLTLWNVEGVFEDLDKHLLEGIDSTVNIVTRTDRPDTRSADGLWVENISNVTPKNLYKSQLARRLGTDEPQATVSLLSQTVSESAGTAQVIARLSQASSKDVRIGVHSRPVSAINGQDFFGISETVVIPAGSLEASAAVTIIDDNEREAAERFELRIYSASGAEVEKGVAVVTIEANDTTNNPALSIQNGRVTEGQSYFIKLSLNSPTDRVVSATVATRPGSAVNGVDYYGLYQSVEIAPGKTEARIPVTILNDTAPESTESFGMAILKARGATVAQGQAVTVIEDDD